MDALPIHVFKDSFIQFLNCSTKNEIKYQIREQRSGTLMASSGVIEIIVNASIWVSLASVLIAFIKAKNNREVTITTEDNQIIHAKGLDSQQLQDVLKHAKGITAIEPHKKKTSKLLEFVPAYRPPRDVATALTLNHTLGLTENDRFQSYRERSNQSDPQSNLPLWRDCY